MTTPALPDGLVAIVKRDCPTCRLVAPVLAEMARVCTAGGAIVIEYLFSYPGLGYLFYTATTNHDLPLMQGLFLFYTLAVLVCVLIADLITAVLDPRTRDA